MKLKGFNFKIKPFSKPKQIKSYHKISKILTGVVRKEDNTFVVRVNMSEFKSSSGYNNEVIPPQLVLEFTPDSYDTKGRLYLFKKNPRCNNFECRIISEFASELRPLPKDLYVPFWSGWTVKGWVCRVDGRLMFKFGNLVSQEGYIIGKIHNEE